MMMIMPPWLVCLLVYLFGVLSWNEWVMCVWAFERRHTRSMKLYKFILMQNLLRFSAHSFHFPVNCTWCLITLLRQVDKKCKKELHSFAHVSFKVGLLITFLWYTANWHKIKFRKKYAKVWMIEWQQIIVFWFWSHVSRFDKNVVPFRQIYLTYIYFSQI